MDGKLDILSGCYWTDGAKAGQIQLLRGEGSLNFATALSVENESGKPLENLQINEANDKRQTETICTHQHAVDFDGDNDLDLVVGCFAKSFYLYENVAGPGEKPALREPSPLDVESPDYHASPHLVDWDNDGDLDLLSGAAGGGVLFSENIGTSTQPKYADFQRIVDTPQNGQHKNNGSDAPQMGDSTRVWATDYNGDGLLDLLVGDMSSVAQRKPGLSDDDYHRRKATFDKEMTAASEAMANFQQEHQAEFEAMQKGEAADVEFRKQLNEVSMQMQAAQQSQREFQTSTRTGFVWLLIRKPMADLATAN